MLTTRLSLALVVASLFVALVVGFLAADRRNKQNDTELAVAEAGFAAQLAERVAPLLERRDVLRLSVLATVASDNQRGRVVMLDQKGRVVLDTALVLGDRQLGLLTHGGPFQRTTLRDDGSQQRESLVPVRFGGEVIGEVRLQVSPKVATTTLDAGLFGLVFLGCLSLVAVAAAMVHHWSARVRHATDALLHLAAGEVGRAPNEPAPGELLDLGNALQELERGVQDGLVHVAEGFLAMAFQVVDGLERRQLVVPGHGERSAGYAGLLARRLGLLPADQRDLELAARLQDLGKAWVRESLLTKTESLSELELSALQRHPQHAAEQLDRLPSLRRVASIVRHQGERYDGNGEPGQLRGDRIPLGSRVLAIASAFDLLLCCGDGDGNALQWDVALERLGDGRGRAYDPWLLDLFAEELRKSPPRSEDRPVMILPPGAVALRGMATGTEGEDDDLLPDSDGELELLADDVRPEERA